MQCRRYRRGRDHQLIGPGFEKGRVNTVPVANIAVTDGAVEREMAAGSVIHSFGSFVAGDQIAIGLVIPGLFSSVTSELQRVTGLSAPIGGGVARPSGW